MRILYVFDSMGIGGAETMIMNILRLRIDNNMVFDFIVHTSYKGEFHDEIREMGGNIIICPIFSIRRIIDYYIWWEKFFQQNSYDIVHGNYRKSSPIYLQVAKKHGIATIMHTHSASTRSNFSFLRKIPAYFIYTYSDQIFACSVKAAKWLFGNKIINDKKLKIINNGINTSLYTFDLQKRDKIRNEMNLQGKIVICHVGRFAPMKNHIFLVRVFEEIKKLKRNSVLLLIGDGELYPSIQKYVKEKKIEDIKFLGIRRDVQDLLQAADVFVLPSLFEGLPLSLVEAQAASLPCVCADTITKEAFIGKNVLSLSLNEKEKKWAKVIINVSLTHQRMPVDFSSNPFDVHVSAKSVMDVYKEIKTRT